MQTEKSCVAYWARIYLAGPVDEMKQIIRRECMREGLCVTVTPTDYLYTGGSEVGAIIELVNYPRFPQQVDDILHRAVDLAIKMRDETFQHSVMVMVPTMCYWYSMREQ